jgi:hypothetical protein
MMKQLPSQNEVTLALDGLPLTKQLTIMSVVAYYMNSIWALQEVQFRFDEIDSQLFSILEN